MHRALIRMAGAARNFIFPSRCLACGNLFRVRTHGLDPGPSPPDCNNWTWAFFCGDCRDGWTPVRAPICPRCGLMFKSREGEDHLCQNCVAAPRHFFRARAAGLYAGPLMQAVHRFKYHGDTHLAAPLGRLLFQTFREHFAMDPVDLILPVPLHRRKFKQRGFNQSFLLVRNWEKSAWAMDGERRSFSIARNELVRVRATSPQTGLGRNHRLANIRNAFQIAEPDKIKGKRILLVDDVYTTGATVDECARVLLKHQARQVDVLTLARAMTLS